jgi:magnesium transporter
MRVFSIKQGVAEESSVLPLFASADTLLWVSCTRDEFEQQLSGLQAALQTLCGMQLVDLHVSDLLNDQLPSHFDYTSQYDLLIFRRLAALQNHAARPDREPASKPSQKRSGPPILQRIDTSPVGFAVFDQVLLSVHPNDCAVRDVYASRLFGANTAGTEPRSGGSRMPTSTADLMLRIVNQMVDGFLELRRELTKQLDHWQTELLNPRTRFSNWSALLEARMTLHQLDAIGEDQRACVQDWIEALKLWPLAQTPLEQRDRDLLQVRSRDVLEHIERVVHHVQRLEQSVETAVQMHFSAQSNRTNDIMRTLTALTAIFLPLNLIAGIFGMNFEFIPLVHSTGGFWWAITAMLAVTVSLVLIFWRKRYLARSQR